MVTVEKKKNLIYMENLPPQRKVSFTAKVS